MNGAARPHPLFVRLADPARAARPALRRGAGDLDYAALSGAVGALAAALAEAGVERGDKVPVACAEVGAHLVAVLAVLAAGGVAVPLPAAMAAARRAEILARLAPQLMVADAGQAAGGVAALSLTLDDAGRPVLDDRTLAPRPVQPPPLDERALAMIRFTSGSTGRPKGVALDHAQLLWSAGILSGLFGFTPEHRELLVAPVALSGAWQRALATLWAGGCLVPLEGPPALPVLLETAGREKISGFYTPPPLARLLLQGETRAVRAALAGCRTLEIGSAPVSGEEVRGLLALLPRARVLVHYGLTECSRAVVLDARAHPECCHTVGRPAPGVALQVVDQAGRPLPPGQSGAIRLRGPQLARGYLDDRGRLQPLPGGWLETGDQGLLDEQGFLIFQGRCDERINCGGHSFYPAEVERLLAGLPGVAHCLVAGVDDPQGLLGEVPWAYVVPGAGWSQRDFMRAARRVLPPHQVPRGVTLLDNLPLTPAGKPDRRALGGVHQAPGGGSRP